MSHTTPEFTLTPYAGRIGAEIGNIKLTGDLALATFDPLYQALLKYKVLFFKGQQHLDDDSHTAFAQRFGDLVAHPTLKAKGAHILELDSNHGGRANSWHTDVTFEAAYPKVSVLRGVVIPPYGGDTVWANTAAAYSDLPTSLREQADRLWALHTNDYDYATHKGDRSPEEVRRFKETFVSSVYEAEHPVVRVHPETGERSLLLGHFAREILNHGTAESAALLRTLQGYVTRLENTVRWRWTQGDVVIWDNRATQHYAINDYGDAHRVVRRITVGGDVPVSVDGRQSRAIKARAVAQAANAPSESLRKAA